MKKINVNDGGTYIEKNKGDIYIGKKNKGDEQTIENTLFNKWWFISFIIAILLGTAVGFYLSSFYIGLIVTIILFLTIQSYNPERRFFRKANIILAVGIIHINHVEILFYNSSYGFIKIGDIQFPWVGMFLLILSGFLFWIDYKKDMKS